MDYSLLLIKANKRTSIKRILESPEEEEMMPAMVLMRNVKGEARLELRNSIVVRHSIKRSFPNKTQSIKTETRTSNTGTNYKSAVDNQLEANPAVG
jgi:hypothetical protein